MQGTWYLRSTLTHRGQEYWPVVFFFGVGSLLLTFLTVALPELVAYLFAALMLCATLILFAVAYRLRKLERRHAQSWHELW